MLAPLLATLICLQPAPTAQAATPKEACRISPEAMRAAIAKLPLKRSPWGSDEHTKGLRETEELILRELQGMGFTPWTQDVKWVLPGQPKNQEGDQAPAPPTPWRNIIVDIPGTDPMVAREVLILGAHFDAVPKSPGADDNGSGFATLLEISRCLAGQRFRRSIRLCYFNLEEVGLLGAAEYVRLAMPNWRESKDPADASKTIPAKETVIGMLSLETMGFYSDAADSQKSPIKKSEMFDPPTVGNFLAITGIARFKDFSQRLNTLMLQHEPTLKTVVVDFMPVPVPDMMRSDHRPFVMAGVPGLMITDTANFRNPHYHQPTDTIETIDFTRLTQAANAILGATRDIAEPVAGK
jgi:hypothetical protein